MGEGNMGLANGPNFLRGVKLESGGYDSITAQRVERVRDFLLLSDIPEGDRAKIVAAAQQRTYAEGKTIFFEGDAVRQVVLLTSGCVKLSQIGPQGQEVILRLAGVGDCLGAECFPKYRHCSTAKTMKPSTGLVWEAIQFEAIAERFPTLGRNVVGVLLRTLTQLEVRFREVCTERVAPRLSNELVRLANQVGNRSNGHIEIKVSQRDLAQLTGMTLFTVSRVLGQWEEMGVVRTQRQALLVLDLSALESLSGSE
jgi:CRP/FNR family transcriptional regulator, nitrogen oxide reductase regulator